MYSVLKKKVFRSWFIFIKRWLESVVGIGFVDKSMVHSLVHWVHKGELSVEIKLSELRKVKGIGPKAMERVREHLDKLEGDKAYVSEYDPEIHVNVGDLVQGDMLEVMNGIPDKSVDMILTDLPYGTTRNKWDSIIDLKKMWEQYERVIKDVGIIVLFSQPPFDATLVSSNEGLFKYKWYWQKETGSGHLNANYQPMKNIEELLVFSKGPTSYTKSSNPTTYNPQMRKGFKPYEIKKGGLSDSYDKDYTDGDIVTKSDGDRFPQSLISFTREPTKLHPTQKPVALLEYLIKTYTNENEVVLDSTMGSGSTGVAAYNTNRQFIGVELDEEYFDIATERIKESMNE